MKLFMDENFLLNNRMAEILYHDHAKKMPILDYHCHLSPKEIAENKKYRNISEIWFGQDHYKWRAMRSNGIDEKYITGDASDKEKFLKWADTMPNCLGNPLYHWSHLELKRYFGIDKLLSPATAEEIWQKCNEMLGSDEFSARRLIERSNVKVVCTTDDPIDTLEYHIALANDITFGVKVLPTFRPDKAINIEQEEFALYMGMLGTAAEIEIKTFENLKEALLLRIEFFHKVGCRLSDHGMEYITYKDTSEEESSGIFKKALSGSALTKVEIEKYKTYVLLFLGKEYARRDWVMQLHMGSIRNNSKRMMKLLGPDSGFDAIGDYEFSEALSKTLNAMDETHELPRTILCCLNPRDNEVIGAMIGCFQGGGIPGKMQFGPGWWFNDQKDGMIRHMTALANLSLLSRFVGMLTDSRNFLSYTRHEYFRRVLCNLLGEWMEKGEVPGDIEMVGNMVRDICYNNANNYFQIN